MKKDETKYITLSTIKERGWTDKLIKEYLPNPDKTAQNPHYRSASPMKLYELNKIINLEENIQYIKEYVEKTKEKRESLREKAEERELEIKRIRTEILDILKLRDFTFKEKKEEVDTYILENSPDNEEPLSTRYLSLCSYIEYFRKKKKNIISDLNDEFGESFEMDPHKKYVDLILDKKEKEILTAFGFTKYPREEIKDALKGKDFTFYETKEDILEFIRKTSNNPKIEEELNDQLKTMYQINRYFEQKSSEKINQIRIEFKKYFNMEILLFVEDILKKESSKALKNFGYITFKDIEVILPKNKEELFVKLKEIYNLSNNNKRNKKIVKLHAGEYLLKLYEEKVDEFRKEGYIIPDSFVHKGKNMFKNSFKEIFKKLEI